MTKNPFIFYLKSKTNGDTMSDVGLKLYGHYELLNQI